MSTRTRIKVCGLVSVPAVDYAVDVGVDYVGLVFFPKSPRNVSIGIAAALSEHVPASVHTVALMVDPDDDLLARVIQNVQIDMIQLHGSETPDRVAEVRRRTLRPVMKAVGVAEPDDLQRVAAYANAADQVLIDAKPPRDADLPGGNGEAFDWTILQDVEWTLPWMLAGGLNARNVGDALRISGAPSVDVSTGVEIMPGEKDGKLIREFVDAVRAA